MFGELEQSLNPKQFYSGLGMLRLLSFHCAKRRGLPSLFLFLGLGFRVQCCPDVLRVLEDAFLRTVFCTYLHGIRQEPFSFDKTLLMSTAMLAGNATRGSGPLALSIHLAPMQEQPTQRFFLQGPHRRCFNVCNLTLHPKP